ncbi:MAG: hypothetical protein ABIP51_16760 [Bacteroidia bacterium]
MSELVKKILIEAEVNDHFYERLKARLSADIVTLAVEVKNAQYEVIGTYKMPESFKTRVLSAISFINDYTFPYNKSFGVKLGFLKIIERDIQFSSLTAKRIYDSVKDGPVVYDPTTNSNGDVVFAIVRNNQLVTLYWGKSYTPQTKEKLQVDMVINDIEVLRKASFS